MVKEKMSYIMSSEIFVSYEEPNTTLQEGNIESSIKMCLFFLRKIFYSVLLVILKVANLCYFPSVRIFQVVIHFPEKLIICILKNRGGGRGEIRKNILLDQNILYFLK